MAAGLPRETLKWILSLDLSYPVKSVRRDFANGFLFAEVLSRYYPQDVPLHSFENVASTGRKKANWHLLEKLFRKKQIPVDRSQIDAIMTADSDAAVELLQQLHAFIHSAAFEASQAGSSTADAGCWAAGQQGPTAAAAAAAGGYGYYGPGAVADNMHGASAMPAGPGSQMPGQQQTPMFIPAGQAPGMGVGMSPLQAPCFGGMAPGAAAYHAAGMAGHAQSMWAGMSEWTQPMQCQPSPAQMQLQSGGVLMPPPMYMQAPGQPAYGYYPGGLAREPSGHAHMQPGYSDMHSAQAMSGGQDQGRAAARSGHSPQAKAAQACGSKPGAAAAAGPGKQKAGVRGSPPAARGLSKQPQLAAVDAYRLAEQQGPASWQQEPWPGEAGLQGFAAAPYGGMLQYEQQYMGGLEAGGYAAAGPGLGPAAHSSSGSAAGEQIPYSKARPVDYQPYDIKDYEDKAYNVKRAGAGYWQLGRLGPDLETPELQAKREKAERVKAMAAQVREQNMKKAVVASVKPRKETAKEPSARDRALQFAKQVPKPEPQLSKPAGPGALEAAAGSDGASSGSKRDAGKQGAGGLGMGREGAAAASQLQLLEAQHAEDQRKVDAIRAQLARML